MGLDYSGEIAPFDGDLRITWRATGADPLQYCVNGDDVKRIADDIRDALRVLVTRTLRSGDVVSALDGLVKLGHLLYTALFTVVEGRTPQEAVDQFRQSLFQRGDHPNVCFIVHRKVHHVPWALMSDAPVRTDPHDGRVVSYPSFWALKYAVSTVYNGLVSADLLSANYAASDFDTLAAVDTDVHEKAKAQLVGDSEEAQVFLRLSELYDPPLGSARTLLSEWNKREARLGLLYFYGHATATRIMFSQDDLDTIDFKAKYKKRSVSPRCLVFLNGCHTAASRFMEATGSSGFCGFVGAETVLPYVFAHRFGAALIGLLYSGQTLVAIIDRLREQHWPLSLAYGLYACPFLRLDPSFPVPMPSMDNYSNLSLGDKVI